MSKPTRDDFERQLARAQAVQALLANADVRDIISDMEAVAFDHFLKAQTEEQRQMAQALALNTRTFATALRAVADSGKSASVAIERIDKRAPATD